MPPFLNLLHKISHVSDAGDVGYLHMRICRKCTRIHDYEYETASPRYFLF